MPRSSRHRSHRSHRHSRDRSESEEDETSRERKPSVEEPATSPAARGSRDPDPEKRRSSRAASNGDSPEESGKKRKERADEAAVSVRCNDYDEDDLKRPRREELSPSKRDKSSKSKLLDDDSKGRSTRRHDGSRERKENKLEKDFSKRESSSQYKDAKERDRLERERERERDKDRDAQMTNHDKLDDVPKRRHGFKTDSTKEEYASNKDTKLIESQAQDALPNYELEMGLEKHMRSRDDSEDKDKLLVDHRNNDDRRFSSRDDYTTNRSYRDERLEDIKYRDKHRDDLFRDQKQRNDKHRDERSSRGRASERSENRYFRDENKASQGRYKKSKHHDDDHDGNSCLDDHVTKSKDSRGKKRLFEENEDHHNLMPRGMKEPGEDVEKNMFSTSRIDSYTNPPRSRQRHKEKFDYSPRNNQPKNSASSSACAIEDCKRDSSKQELAQKDSSLEEIIHNGAASTRQCSLASGAHERVSETRSEKIKPRDDAELGQMYEETIFSKPGRTSRSNGRASPDQMKEKSPSNEKRFSDISGSRLSLNLGVGQKWNTSRDGDRGDMALQKLFSQKEVSNREATPSSSINQTSHLFGGSPNHLHPPLPLRLDSPSVFGSYEDDNREQSGNSKYYGRHKRSGDLTFGRGHSNWKSAPSWPPALANGFNPLQHGLPPAGFHPAVPHFPAPPFFGVRPYNMHDVADSFPVPGRPFGWHGALNQPHMQMWDANNGVFGDDGHIYGRPEWDLKRHHLIGSRGWEIDVDMWKGEDGTINVPKKESEHASHALAEEAWISQPGNQPYNDQAQLGPLPVENTEAKQSSDVSSAKNIVSPLKLIPDKTPELSEITGGDTTNSIANYLSRIDISPILVDSELYRNCTSLLGVKGTSAACKLFTYQQFQINSDESIDKMKNTCYVSKSLLPTAKDAIFQRAMSLYKQQNKRSGVKIPVSPTVCSDEVKGSAEASDNGKVPLHEKGRVGEQSSDEKTLLPDPECESGNNITPDTCSVCPGDNKDQQLDLKSDAVNFADGSESCEALVEDCRRPNNRESTL